MSGEIFFPTSWPVRKMMRWLCKRPELEGQLSWGGHVFTVRPMPPASVPDAPVENPDEAGTVAKVNAELRRLGHPERLRRGRAYYYFSGGRATEWKESAVYVAHVWQLTVGQWIAERKRLEAGE